MIGNDSYQAKKTSNSMTDMFQKASHWHSDKAALAGNCQALLADDAHILVQCIFAEPC